MLGNIGTLELLVIAGVLILLFGSKKIPELVRALRDSISEFRGGLKEKDKEV
jgi:sec-independent protein translocase protein TatA